MSLSARKRNSKWDSKEGSPYIRRNAEESDWSECREKSSFDSKPHSWHSDAADSSRSKWPALGRGSRRTDTVHDHHSKTLNTVSRWDEDETYGSRMSPGLDEWRLQNHHRSPKDEWRRAKRSRSRSRSRGRSRSRSPYHGLRRDYGASDKNKSTLCRNFASGRCRRGDQCWFLHEDSQIRENRFDGCEKSYNSRHSDSERTGDWRTFSHRRDDSIERKYKRGGRYPYPGSDHSELGLSSEASRDSNNRNKDMGMDRPDVRDSHPVLEVPCKFFAAGRCRNGTNCRFQHCQGPSSPRKMSSKEDRSKSQTLNESDKHWNGTDWSTKDDKLSSSQSGNSTREVDGDKSLRGNADRFGDKVWVRDEVAPESELEDVEMSPEWNYRIGSSNAAEKGANPSLHTSDNTLARGASGVVPPLINEPTSIQPNCKFRENVISSLSSDDKGIMGKPPLRDSFLNMPVAYTQNGISTNVLQLHALNDPVPFKLAATVDSSRLIAGSTFVQKSQDEMILNKLDIREALPYQVGPDISMSQKMSPNNPRAICNSDPAVGIGGHHSIGHQIQANELRDNAGSNTFNDHAGNTSVTRRRDIGAEHIEAKLLPLPVMGIPINDAGYKFGSQALDSHNHMKPETLMNLENMMEGCDKGMISNRRSETTVEEWEQNVGKTDNERLLKEGDAVKENGLSENLDDEKEKGDGSKKSKDAKFVRSFKFALAEFVKELMKPKWKEGQMSKESYKVIVKKVVDKVTRAMNSSNIPQSQEKIDNYLSVSKPKLAKLVQAYVEKSQKKND